MSRADGSVLVAGAGGFIGGHLTRALDEAGLTVRAVDSRPPAEWHQHAAGSDEIVADLSLVDDCRRVLEGVSDVYNFAADMGGMGFIERNKALCMLSVLINTHLLLAARDAGARRFFFASSACVYPADRQETPAVEPLRESDVYPAMPEDGYGWEKLFDERMCRHFSEDFGISTRVARYHNVYGPFGSFDGGREKAPAAVCRKVAIAALTGTNEIEIWGDGEQTRSFTYIDDAVEGTRLLMGSDVSEPLNIGSSELVSINRLVDLVEEIAGVRLRRTYVLDAPLGVRGRNSDNSLVRERLGWEPTTALTDGLAATYRWIHDQVASRVAK